MQTISTSSTLAQAFYPVKSRARMIIGTPPDSVIHHKSYLSVKGNLILSYGVNTDRPYGVSRDYRVLTKGILLKKHDYIDDCLRVVLGLTRAQRSVVHELLRLWTYYGMVVPSEAFISEESWTSKPTFWRTIRQLRDRGLVSVVNRYVMRPHAQISNLYRLDKLIIILAHYLAEHIAHIWPDWLDPWFKLTWPQLWESFSDEVDISWRSPPRLSPL